jgi:hypothetical protein
VNKYNNAHLNDTLAALFEELEPLFFERSDPRCPGENPACDPIEDKIEAELLKMTDEEIVALVDSTEPSSRLSIMLMSPIIGVVDEGRTDLDPHINPNKGDDTIYWHGWPDGVPIPYKRKGDLS